VVLAPDSRLLHFTHVIVSFKDAFTTTEMCASEVVFIMGQYLIKLAYNIFDDELIKL